MHELNLSMTSLPLVIDAGIVHNSKPFILKTHRQEYHVLGYITHGNIEITEERENYNLNTDSVLVLTAGHPFFSKELSAPNTNWYYIRFHLPESTDPTIDLKNFIPLSASSSLQPKDYQFSITIPKFVQLQPGNIIREKIEKLILHYESDSPLRFGYHNALLLDILMDLVNAKVEKQHSDMDTSNINALLHYLNNHVESPFHSEEIAKAMNLNYKYMCELFKKKTGTTIQQYHTLLKMKEAERYLKTTELPIGEISTRLGYQDSLYFSNVFKKHHGISPRQYRQKNHTTKISE